MIQGSSASDVEAALFQFWRASLHQWGPQCGDDSKGNNSKSVRQEKKNSGRNDVTWTLLESTTCAGLHRDSLPWAWQHENFLLHSFLSRCYAFYRQEQREQDNEGPHFGLTPIREIVCCLSHNLPGKFICITSGKKYLQTVGKNTDWKHDISKILFAFYCHQSERKVHSNDSSV